MLGASATFAACEGAAPPVSPVPTSAETAGPTAAATGARRAGRIAVYSALEASTSDLLVAAFRAATPDVEVDVLSVAPASELHTRIRVERKSRKADIFLGGDSFFHDGLAKEGLLEPHAAANAGAFAAGSKDPNSRWSGWYVGILGIATNADRFNTEIGGVKPATWDDLLDPKYRGKVTLPDPIKTGAGYVFVATHVFRFDKDEARAMDYMKKLHANVAQYPGTSPQAIQLVSQGQLVVASTWAHEILTQKAMGPAIELVVPDGTGYEIGAVSIVKGTKDLPAAKAFVDWVLSKEAGEVYVNVSKRVSVRDDVPPPSGGPALTALKLVSYDREWAARNRDRLLQLWQKSVGL